MILLKGIRGSPHGSQKLACSVTAVRQVFGAIWQPFNFGGGGQEEGLEGGLLAKIGQRLSRPPPPTLSFCRRQDQSVPLTPACVSVNALAGVQLNVEPKKLTLSWPLQLFVNGFGFQTRGVRIRGVLNPAFRGGFLGKLKGPGTLAVIFPQRARSSLKNTGYVPKNAGQFV